MHAQKSQVGFSSWRVKENKTCAAKKTPEGDFSIGTRRKRPLANGKEGLAKIGTGRKRPLPRTGD